ncbi:MAG: trans-2-enoyl-CoA reductase family protein [Pseudomonadales bacterium]|jgi:enoyl-[acyl-carrier protein] reductase/trans-2-enoyl-CoA reductase (NAD+)|nr:trans-2-enoyl-CoA reductase family protein [Pseudomonadales bacterium]MDP6469508.1 trans-2-enoyl-CoA reductase family protein [Pseudomonadales bacterium]MDP6827350.1 trans-2-enoyl-CoA reductase family protein [Pseudomonadales bacterium]MDP6971172.1 trans-2-enoyl-CoA reductase family protein [Pseudomonadales bacterium]|tara:strand:+ start:629 stop:1825 length:1197 start_codon:yes stop_codon:yes gene_type:complete
MIVKPRVRGFICTTAHPTGCTAHVAAQFDVVGANGDLDTSVKKALVIGCSGGYGLASRIVLTEACSADTIGVSFEKPPSDAKTATAGWYNNVAFDELAAARGRFAKTLDGDAFSDEMKVRVIEEIREHFGQIDMLIYSLASPVRQHPRTGTLHRSVLKPLGEMLDMKSINVDTGEVNQVTLEPGTDEEVANTVAVMGGEDWEFWVDALRDVGALADGFRTLAFTYIGSDLTWPIYWDGTLGKAKEDLDRAASALRDRLQGIGGSARIVSLKSVVTQASVAIPVVPLYVSLLFRVMKQQGSYETLIEHVYRLFATQLNTGAEQRLDEGGRIRVDDLELKDAVQDEVKRLWPLVTSENIDEIADLEGFRNDFLRIFGFGFACVDYDADVDPTLGKDVETF